MIISHSEIVLRIWNATKTLQMNGSNYSEGRIHSLPLGRDDDADLILCSLLLPNYVHCVHMYAIVTHGRGFRFDVYERNLILAYFIVPASSSKCQTACEIDDLFANPCVLK